ncbi:MAG: Hpt domain-containing protein [Clostridiales bacterium]|nr:Hpt domain-containing protein [Clostridiales bacterium]
MSELLDALASRGNDACGALERFLGDEALYETCFRQFLADPAFPALEAALDSGDGAAAFEAAHTIKGVAGNLGLTELYRAACALAEPLRHGGSTAGLEPRRQALGRAKAALDALAD